MLHGTSLEFCKLVKGIEATLATGLFGLYIRSPYIVKAVTQRLTILISHYIHPENRPLELRSQPLIHSTLYFEPSQSAIPIARLVSLLTVISQPHCEYRSQ